MTQIEKETPLQTSKHVRRLLKTERGDRREYKDSKHSRIEKYNLPDGEQKSITESIVLASFWGKPSSIRHRGGASLAKT